MDHSHRQPLRPLFPSTSPFNPTITPLHPHPSPSGGSAGSPTLHSTTSSSSQGGGGGGAGGAVVFSNSKRPIQSCAECKRRKIKCNRVIPCSPCLLRGEESTCREVERLDPSTTFASLNEVETLNTRVASLESQLLALQDTVKTLATQDSSSRSGTDASPHETLQQHHQLSLEPDRPRSADPTAVAEARRAHPDEEVALVLEDFAMGHMQNRNRATQRLVSKPDGSTALNSPAGSNGMGELRNIRDDNPLAFFVPAGFDYILKVLTVCPDAARSWSLVQFYFGTLHWYTAAIHKPSFLVECQKLLSVPLYEASRSVRPEFLCCHLMVLCLSLHLIEPEVAAALGYTMDHASMMAKNLFSMAQAMLWASDFLSSHSIDHLQCFVLMSVYQFNVDDSDSAWAMLGLAIKVAQNLGLSRLGTENESRRKLWPTAWRSFKTREIGRRLWWQLVMLDWSHATAHSSTYAIHPSQTFTSLPSNVNDDDMLSDSRDFVSRPIEEYTEGSFNIFKIRFVVLYRELVDHLNTHSPASYPFILNMDMRLVKLMDSLPPHFRDAALIPDNPDTPNLIKEAILLGVTGENRLLRLHRPYLSRGYREAKYAASKDRCVHSARNILALLKVAGARCPELLRFWLLIFYSFTACIVTFIDLTRSPCEATRTTLRETLALLKTAENVSAAARNAISLLEGLFAAEAELAAQVSVMPLMKRKRDEEGADSTDPFQKVVNRLLLAASSPQHESTSPSNTGPSPSSVTSLSLAFDPNSSTGGGLSTGGGASGGGVFDFLTAPPSTSHPELDVFVGVGARPEDDAGGYAADLSHLFSSDFGPLSDFLADFEQGKSGM